MANETFEHFKSVNGILTMAHRVAAGLFIDILR